MHPTQETEVVEALLRLGSDPNAPSRSGWTALMCAARKGHGGVAGARRGGRVVREAGAEEGPPLAQPRLVAHGVVIRLVAAERLVLVQTMMGTMETTTYLDVVTVVAVGRMTVVTEETVESQVGEAEAEEPVEITLRPKPVVHGVHIRLVLAAQVVPQKL